jgi:hypothetical protein
MNPVMAALLKHKASEVSERQTEVSNIVYGRIGYPPLVPVPDAFNRWCEERGLISCPATPETIALFVLQNAALEADALSALLEGITAGHQHLGDPVASWQVNRALELAYGEVKMPRSWKKEKVRLFNTLPYFVKSYIAYRDKQVDTALRRAQNEAGDLRHKFKQMEEAKEANADENKTAA